MNYNHVPPESQLQDFYFQEQQQPPKNHKGTALNYSSKQLKHKNCFEQQQSNQTNDQQKIDLGKKMKDLQLKSRKEKKHAKKKEKIPLNFQNNEYTNEQSNELQNLKNAKTQNKNELKKLGVAIQPKQELQSNTKSITEFDDNSKLVRQHSRLSNVTKQFSKEIKRKKYLSSEDQARYNLKRLIAKVVCLKGYSWGVFTDYVEKTKIQIDIQREQFTNAAYWVATETFRRLEFFLIKECSIRIKPLYRQQVKSISCILLNCRVYFQQSDVATFFKFIYIVYQMADVSISQEYAGSLYISIMDILKTRVTCKYLKPAVQKNAGVSTNKEYNLSSACNRQRYYKIDLIWNKQLEKELIQLYKIEPSLAVIRDYFKEKMPQKSEYFTNDGIRSRLSKVIRYCLKKLHQESVQAKGEMPKIQKMNDLRIKFIQRAKQGYQLRIKMIDAFVGLHKPNEDTIKQIIQGISKLISFKQHERGLQQNQNGSEGVFKSKVGRPKINRAYMLPQNGDNSNGKLSNQKINRVRINFDYTNNNNEVKTEQIFSGQLGQSNFHYDQSEFDESLMNWETRENDIIKQQQQWEDLNIEQEIEQKEVNQDYPQEQNGIKFEQFQHYFTE